MRKRQPISFQQLDALHEKLVFAWLAEPHIREFWDNTQAHKDDIINFVNGRKAVLLYCEGKYIYWLAYYDEQPYAMLMTIQETDQDDIGELKQSYLSQTGHTYGIDFMIGNTDFLYPSDEQDMLKKIEK